MIFFTIALTIYFLVNYYIFIRGWQSLPAGSGIRGIYLTVFLALSISYVAGRIVERFWLGPLSNALVWTGSFWLAAMLWFFLIILLIDIIRLVNVFLPVIPEMVTQNIRQAKPVLFGGAVIMVFFVTIAGHVNTWYPVVNSMDISLDGKNSKMDRVKVALISDIHLGSLTPKNRIRKMVDKVNALEPDIILIAGDILDEDVGPVIERDLGSAIINLYAPLGVYAVTGNHEYIGGINDAAGYLTSHGITLLRDSVVRINDSFYLAGREDLNSDRFAGIPRMSVEELLGSAGKDLPVIVMDHQPFSLERAAAAGADLQLSGHTHHGQIWPLNFITRAVYTISRGYGEVDGMKVYVSSGIGTWGPPVRLGTRPEIVLLNIALK